MNFDELFANICETMQREQRISYRALKQAEQLPHEKRDQPVIDLVIRRAETLHYLGWRQERLT